MLRPRQPGGRAFYAGDVALERADTPGYVRVYRRHGKLWEPGGLLSAGDAARLYGYHPAPDSSD